MERIDNPPPKTKYYNVRVHLPAKQKFAAYGAGIALLFGASFVGTKALRPDAPLSVAPISGETRTPDAPPRTEAPAPVEKPQPAPTEVVVAMAGAVKTPGLLHLDPDTRVGDAIKRAGGAKPDADLEAINLAAKAVDGDQIYVPRKKAAEPERAAEAERVVPKYRGGEIAPHYAPLTPDVPATLQGELPSEGSPSSSPRSAAKKKASGPVSLSTASLAQLETLPGVGPATAQKILDYRMEHGGFSSIDEIQAVKGIGPKKFEKMKPFLKR